jgi:hypothetical protein
MKESKMLAVICIAIASMFLLAGIIATKYVDSGATDAERSSRRTGAAIFIAAIIIGGYYAFDEMLGTII